jgi:hypothetical protein
MAAFRKLLREVIRVANTMQYFLIPLMRATLEAFRRVNP